MSDPFSVELSGGVKRDPVVIDDAMLVSQCLAGSAPAKRRLIDRHHGVVFGLCYRMLGHRQDAEDTCQEVFLRVFRSLAQWDSTRQFRPWLLAIAANRCRTQRQRRTRIPVPSEFADDAQTDDGTNGAVRRELSEELELALAELRENYRTAFCLFYEQELSVAEVAELMETREGTVKTWLHRARHELAERLSRRGVGPEYSS